jgi:transmembrane sensor
MENHETLLETETKEKKVKGVAIISIIVLIISLLLGFMIYKFTSSYFEKMAMMKKSSETKRNVEVILPDGSKVWLNSNSEIRYPKQFTPDRREVFFEGEAFFAVVKNEEKPFIINSKDLRIEVVGTTFNLRANLTEPELIINVVSGEVILFDKETDKNAIQLKKGEQGIFNHESRRMTRIVNEDINYLSWQTGKFFFKQAPFSDVITTLINHYGQQIVFENEVLKHCKITISIDNKSLREVMAELKKLLPIQCEFTKEKVIIKGSGC